MINDRTVNLDLPLPHADNSLDADVARLRAAMTTLDSSVAGKAPTSHAHAIAAVTGLQTALDGKQAALGFTPVNTAAVGVANGIAPLDATNKVAAAFLPSYVDDVLEFGNFESLPATGEAGKIYVLLAPYTNGGITSSQYRWAGSSYTPIVASPGTTDAVTEGSTNKYFTEPRVLATLLAGLSTATNLAIAAGDSILGAFGKLQKQITDLIATVSTKQAALVSGTNIKTVNSTTLLGSGDLAVQATLVSGSNIKTVGGISLVGAGNVAPIIPIVNVTTATARAANGVLYSLNNSTAQAAATNICLYSNQADNAAWAKAGYTVTASYPGILTPEGKKCDKLVESNATEIHYEIQSFAVAANVQRVFSRRIRASGRSTFYMLLADIGWSNGIVAAFNLATGTVSGITSNLNGSTPAASLVYVGDGWFEMAISGIPNTTGGSTVRVVTYINSNGSYPGDGASGLLVSDAQLELGSVPTSRIETTSAAVTRAAGVVNGQRLLLTNPPADGDLVIVKAANGIDYNLVDPDGYSIEDVYGPMKIDRPHDRAPNLRYLNGSWRLV